MVTTMRNSQEIPIFATAMSARRSGSREWELNRELKGYVRTSVYMPQLQLLPRISSGLGAAFGPGHWQDAVGCN